MSNGNKKNYGTTLYFSQFGGERSIPEQFIAAMERAESRQAGFSADAEIPQEVRDDVNVVEARFDTSERRTNEKILVVIRKLEGNITLRDFRTTDQGLTLQVDSTLFYKTDTTFVRSYPSATQDVAIRDLGNRWSIQEVAVMGTWVDGVFTPGIYQGIELAARREDPIPNALSSGLPVREVQSIVEGTVTQPTLGTDDLNASQRQLAQSKKLLSTFSRDPITLPKTVKYLKELTDLLPTRFRGLIPTDRTSTFVSGTTAPVTLNAGELLRSEDQVNALVKVVEVLSRAGVSFPVEVVETATITEYGGGKVTITSKIHVEGTYTVDEGEGIVSSKITKLGEGHELKETVARVAEAWPTRLFARWLPRLQMFVSGSKQVVAKGSTTAGTSGSDITEVAEIDGYREDKIVTTQPLSLVDDYKRVLHNNTNVYVPPQLVSIESYYTRGGEAGSYTENGSYNLSATYGVGSLQLRGSAQASASNVPELGWVVKIPRTQNIPCKHVLLYVSNTATRAAIVALINTALGSPTPALAEWPDFRPQQMLVLLKGGKANGKLDISASGHDAVATDFNGVVKYSGYSRTNGRGISVDISAISRLVQIPETIHGAISSIGGDGSTNSISYGATGSINCGPVASTPVGGVATAVGSVDILSGGGATPGANQTIPATGQFLHRLVTEPDVEFDRVKVFAEVVDFANIYVP